MMISQGAGGDIRLILGQLQMVRLSRTTLSYDEVKGAQGANKVRSTALILQDDG